MTLASSGQTAIIRTERGLTISGTRIILYDVIKERTKGNKNARHSHLPTPPSSWLRGDSLHMIRIPYSWPGDAIASPGNPFV